MSENKTSEAKIQANRENARKSTGPKTPEGKARSSQNALKHGLMAHHILTRDGDPNEKPADFLEILDGLLDDFDPKTTFERLLIERLAACFWRKRRAYRYESQCIRDIRQGPTDPAGILLESFNPPNRPKFSWIFPKEDYLNRLIRYENMIDRELNRTLTQFHQFKLKPVSSELAQERTRRRSTTPQSTSPLTEAGMPKPGDRPAQACENNNLSTEAGMPQQGPHPSSSPLTKGGLQGGLTETQPPAQNNARPSPSPETSDHSLPTPSINDQQLTTDGSPEQNEPKIPSSPRSGMPRLSGLEPDHWPGDCPQLKKPG